MGVGSAPLLTGRAAKDEILAVQILDQAAEKRCAFIRQHDVAGAEVLGRTEIDRTSIGVEVASRQVCQLLAGGLCDRSRSGLGGWGCSGIWPLSGYLR